MPIETILTYAQAIIGVLLSMLIALVVYVFLSLKGQVQSVAADVSSLTLGRAKLMHKDDCRATMQRFQGQLDEQQEYILQLANRVTRTETLLEIEDHCS